MSEVKKVILGNPKKENDVYKVDLSNPPATEEEAEVVEEEASEDKVIEEVVEEVVAVEKENPAITENTEEEEVVVIGEQPAEEHTTTEEAVSSAVNVPENLESLVSFMKETGGGIEDYVRLNANYDNVDGDALLKE